MNTSTDHSPELDLTVTETDTGLHFEFGPTWTQEQREELLNAWPEIVSSAVGSRRNPDAPVRTEQCPRWCEGHDPDLTGEQMARDKHGSATYRLSGGSLKVSMYADHHDPAFAIVHIHDDYLQDIEVKNADLRALAGVLVGLAEQVEGTWLIG